MALLFFLSLFVLLVLHADHGVIAVGHVPALHRQLAPGRHVNARQVVGALPPAPNAPAMGHGPQLVSASPPFTTITPYPSASPVQITQQSQVVTTYVPQYTLCESLHVAFVPVSATNTISLGPPSLSGAASPSLTFAPDNGTCSTFFSPSKKSICATTLTGLDTTYPVTACDQLITFSTQLGYTITTPTATPTIALNDTAIFPNTSLVTPAPLVQTLTTYYLAPWQKFTSAGSSPDDVQVKICSAAGDDTDQCLLEHEIWVAQLATITTGTTSHISFIATIPGPTQLVIETYVANITETLTTLTMETNMVLNGNLVTETLSTSRLSSPTQTPQSTQTSTITVLPVTNYQPT